MFGLIVSGRLVQTNFVQIPTDPLKFVVDIPEVDGVNHVVLFLTGQAPLPENMGAQIYFAWPDADQTGVTWHLLGHISNQKPSAIFKISGIRKSQDLANGPLSTMTPAGFFGGRSTQAAQIGVSLESIDLIKQSTPATTVDPSTVSTFMEFSQKMLSNFLNYITSYSGGGDGRYLSVPVNIVQNWYDTFLRRLNADPNFWR